MNERRKLLIGAGAAAVWHKPIINSVLTPAHAQASVCPMIVIGNVVFGPVSGTNVPPVCSVTFDVLSGDAATDLVITDITVNAVPADTTITFDGAATFGSSMTATSVMGPRVSWQGPAVNAPFCVPVTPINDVTFTIAATCAAAPGMGTFNQDFTLTQILA